MTTAIKFKAILTEVDAYTCAVQSIAQTLGVTAKDEPMPISKFKSNYSGLLRAALNGSVQQISRGRERYVVLTEGQVIALAKLRGNQMSLADTLASIQIPPMALAASAAMIPGNRQEQFFLINSDA